MKRLSLFVLMFLMTVAIFANGQEETAVGAESFEITVMNNGILKFPEAERAFQTAPGIVEKVVDDFMAKYPNVDVEMVYRDVAKGSFTYDTMLAAGEPPDVWIDASGYFIKLRNDDYAIDLSDYDIDLDKYQPDLLGLYTESDGSVYAIPIVNIATGMAVNLSMLEAVGIELPPVEGWTTDAFLAGAEVLKQAGIPATMIMGKGGMNGWTDVWLYSFGAQMFAPGDTSKVTINSPEALEGLAFIQKVIDRGYTPDPLTINDDSGVFMFCTNRVFSCMLQNGHADPSFPIYLEKGEIDEIPDYTFIEFPHAPGRDHTPVSGYQTLVSAHKTDNEAKNALVAELTGMLASEEVQYYYAIVSGGFPTIKGLSPNLGNAATKSYKAIIDLTQTAGVYKEWPDLLVKNEIRREWKVLSEQWLRGKISPEEFLSEYEARANAILATQ